MRDEYKNKKIDPALFQRYAEGRCTPEEAALIEDWYIAQKRLSPPFNMDEKVLAGDLEEVASRLERYTKVQQTKSNPIKKWLSIAASLALVGFSVYYFVPQQKKPASQQPQEIASENRSFDSPSSSVKHAKTDVAPAQNGAILLLADGEKIYLNSQQNSSKKIDSDLTIDFNSFGEIVYRKNRSDGTSQNNKQTNTIVVPKGHIYNIILADGSRVSLNADSKLTFPIHFNDIRNDLYLEGEAYFEVQKKISSTEDARHREFVVHAGESAVHVLGTKFNVKAYQTDKAQSFVLETGSISLSTPSSPTALLLKPGQKASLSNNSNLRLENVDIQKELAWKNGDFYFENNTLPDILDQLARWYNVEIQYLGPIDDKRYISTISRRKTLKEVLEILESTTGLTFDIQQKGKERRLMVIP